MDRNAYPDDRDLAELRTFPGPDYRPLVERVRELWHDSGEVRTPDAKTVELVTGGWSGNEDVITALSENPLFWMLTWQESHRGGRHVFHLPPLRPPLPPAAPGEARIEDGAVLGRTERLFRCPCRSALFRIVLQDGGGWLLECGRCSNLRGEELEKAAREARQRGRPPEDAPPPDGLLGFGSSAVLPDDWRLF
jgi:hypothetical protein